MDERPKIEVVRVSSTERRNFRPLDGVQLRAAYSHVRVGTYCPEPEPEITTTMICENKPPVGACQSRKCKKNLGPVSRLLRRRHQGTCLATKSCDNIYNVNRNSGSLDWRMAQSATEPALQTRQSNSLDWRVGRTVNPEWRDASRSAEQLSRSPNFTSGGLHTPSAKSKIVSLLRRLSPRMPRPGTKMGPGSLTSSPTVCPWIRVEYSNESVNDTKRDESQESDVSFQRELQLNELRKRMLIAAASASPSSPFPSSSSTSFANQVRNVDKKVENDSTGGGPRIEIFEEEIDEFNPRICIAVHEDRSGQEGKTAATAATTSTAPTTAEEEVNADQRRRRPHRGPGHGEVAGLEENDNCTESTVTGLPGAGTKQNRRTRPLSLAVQPLNYQRLDPESSLENGGGTSDQISRTTIKHPNMTSQESIGSCSLDVDRSASDRSETTIGSVSEKTLHSLNLSCNGEINSPQENLSNGSNETLQKQQQDREQQQQHPVVQIEGLNGENGNAEPEQLTAKKPSYLGLACSISGYSGITRYDSKLREGFRSRDSSPGSRLITRETSPAGFRSHENLGVPGHQYPTKSQSISPLAMDRQNGFSNGAKECKIETFVETRSSINTCQGYSEVDKGIPLHTSFQDISPIRATSPIKRTPGIMQVSSCSRETKSFASSISVSTPRSSVTGYTVSNSSYSESSFANGSSIDAIENQTLNASSSNEKSFIQQRVERLYGPGALAQGFFFKRGAGQHNSSDNSFNKSNSNNNNLNADNANTEESLKNLPVLRHLRPEFRAQLPVVSPRKPTDGSEQIIKPLQRISVTPTRKNEVIVKISGSTNLSSSAIDKEGLKLSASVTSIPDQQPAAPEVVLPVLEPSASSCSIAAIEQTKQPTENAPGKKDGHYFIKLLKAERERLFALAASVEAELTNADPATLPEEAAGKLRSAAGKARLLATQKMQQFEGLCHKNINQVPGEEFPTTDEDLAGFWDMVMLQVVQVNDLFAQIDKLRNSQWQEVIPDKKPVGVSTQNGNGPKRRTIVSQKPKPTATSEANRKAREAREQARRQMIEDRRRAMRSNAQKDDDTVKIFAPET